MGEERPNLVPNPCWQQPQALGNHVGHVHSERHRNAVRDAILRQRFDRVSECVTVVEDLPLTAVEFISFHHLPLDFKALANHRFQDINIPRHRFRHRLAEPLEIRLPGNQEVMVHLADARHEVAFRERLEERSVNDDLRRGVETAELVLVCAEVDGGLAPDAAVGLR